MGFSVVSLIEIVYYFTIRPMCAGQRTRKQRHASRKTRNAKHLKSGWSDSNRSVVTISQTVADRHRYNPNIGNDIVKPMFKVKYRHVSRRLYDMNVESS